MWQRMGEGQKLVLYRYQGGKKSVYLAPQVPAWANVSNSSDNALKHLIDKKSETVERMFFNNRIAVDSLSERHILKNPVLRLTNRCNLRCEHCYQAASDSMRKEKRDLTFSDVKDFLTFAKSCTEQKKWEIQTIQLFGGESTLNPDFLEILEFIVDSKFQGIRISTNGVPKILRSSEMTNYHAQKNIEWRVGLESHKKELQDRIRPSNSYDRVIATIEEIINNGGNVTAKAVLTKENLSHLGDTLIFLRDMGVKQYSYNILSIIGSAAKNELKNSVNHLDAVMALVSILEQDISLATMLHPTPFGRWLKLIYGADVEAYPRIQYFVDADGSVFPNDTLYENREFCVGNIANPEQALKRLIHIQKKLEVDKASCLVCPIKPFCFKGNYGSLFTKDASMMEEFVECESMRESVYYIMQLGEQGREYTRAMYAQVEL